jgi:thiol-disulfide isomerase/thioredoxin
MKASRKVTTILGGLAMATSALAGLKVGDKAPSLGTMEWIKGQPVDFAKDLGKKLYLVEFWATWCPPCKVSIPLLTDLQKKYKDDLTIVSVTSPDPRNSQEMVKQFVTQQGDAMDYTVAFDGVGTTSQQYLLASGAPGIPHAFLVDRKGTIVWQGSPLQESAVHPPLDSIVEGVLAGTFDYEKSNRVIEKFMAINTYAQTGRWPEFLSGLRDILAIDPANQIAMSSMLSVYLDPLGDAAGMTAWAKEYVAQQKDNPTALSRLADLLSSIPDPGARRPALALEAARRAYEVGKTKPRPEFAASYAAALFQIGRLDRAIALQQEAVALARGANHDTERAVLDYYKTCKKLYDESGG